MKPSTYWEERAANAEGAVERLAAILYAHLPSTRNDVQVMIDEWNDIRRNIHKDYEEKATIIITNTTGPVTGGL